MYAPAGSGQLRFWRTPAATPGEMAALAGGFARFPCAACGYDRLVASDLARLNGGHPPDRRYEVPLVIRDVNFDNKGNLNLQPDGIRLKGKFPLVNGTLQPRLDVDRGVYRFRILNGANARVFNLALANGAPFTVIGNDGGLLRSPGTAASIQLGMGERLDV